MKIEIVTLSGANIQNFAPLYAAVFNEAPWLDGWSLPVAAERLHSFSQDPSFRGLGVLVDDQMTGLVLGAGERWSTGWVFNLKEMCIATEYQGSGLGRRLLAEFESHLRLADFKAIYLQTGRHVPARKFYETAGYAEYDHVPLHKQLA